MLKNIAVTMLALCCASMALGQGSGSDPVGERESIVKVLRTSNKAQINKYVCEALEFKNVNPYDIVNFFRSVTSREKGDVYSFKLTGDDPGGFLVVVCPEYQLPALRQLAKELDRPEINSFPGGVWTYYRMKHRDAMDAGFRDAASYFAGSSAIIAPDRDTNSLFFYDAQVGAESMLEALNTTLDKPQSQMELGVKVYEIAANNDGQLGLDYEAWKNGPGKMLVMVGINGQYANVNGLGGNMHQNARGTAFYFDYCSAFFDFLVEKSKAKVLTDTKITVVNDRPAFLNSIEEILYYQVVRAPGGRELHGISEAKGVSSYTFPEGIPTIDSVDAGVRLTILPKIGEQSTELELHLEVVDHLGYQGDGRPLLSSRRMSNVLTVTNGQEVIYGGLSRERKVQKTRKVPFLGSLPGFGWLFGGETTVSQKSLIAVAIMPSRVTEESNVTDEHLRIIGELEKD